VRKVKEVAKRVVDVFGLDFVFIWNKDEYEYRKFIPENEIERYLVEKQNVEPEKARKAQGRGGIHRIGGKKGLLPIRNCKTTVAGSYKGIGAGP